MSWVSHLRNLALCSLTLLLFACQETQERPAELVTIELTDNFNERRKLLRKLSESTNENKAAWGSIYLCQYDVAEYQFVSALDHLSKAEDLIIQRNIEVLKPKLYYLKAHIYWNLGLDITTVTDFSLKAIGLATGTSKRTYEGNYATYLLDAGEYEQVIEIEERLVGEFEAEGFNTSEAKAVLGAAYYYLGLQDIERDNSMEVQDPLRPGFIDDIEQNTRYVNRGLSLMKQSLATLDGVPNVVDKQHVYERALDIGALSDEEIRTCLEFAEANKLWSLAYKVRNSTEAEVLNESTEVASQRLTKVLIKNLEEKEAFKQEILGYEFERLKRETEAHLSREASAQITFTVALFAALLILLISVIFYRTQNLANQAKIEKQDSNILLANYKNRIRPHFLFNQLNNVNGFISQEKWEEAQEYIGLLSVHLRSSLENSEVESTKVRTEFKRIENYVALQQKSSFAHVKFEVELDHISGEIKIPGGLLQPLVENSYKYAGNASEHNSWIKLTARTKGDALIIMVEDSGYGFLERVPGTGSGLALVQERIEFNRAKSSRSELWRFETDFGKRKSTVKLTMPSRLV
ncbi:MAG: Sensor histidine kinase YpdA [Cryomorphaceae bacterium]|nr:MAG: Sensor histidine kinase YpdA [Cryomorphaceae bacterium]